MKLKAETLHFIETFPWESRGQKESFLHLLQWSRKLPVGLLIEKYEAFVIAAFMMQKDREGTDWLVDTVGEQVTILRRELTQAQDRVLAVCNELDDRLSRDIKEIRANIQRIEGRLPGTDDLFL